MTPRGEKKATAIRLAIPGKDGDRYVPMAERTGEVSIVYFMRDLSAAGLRKAAVKVLSPITGKQAIKLHTDEKDGPNIIFRLWVKELVERDLPEATIIETNTYYAGDRDTTEKYRDAIAHIGWTFCPVDITDEDGSVELPVVGGKWFDTMAVGSHLSVCDSMLTLTHFKGHAMDGFGGSNKNIGIGCASGLIGKKWIHAKPNGGAQWSVTNEEFMEKMAESTKAVIDYFGEHVTYVNVMRSMSVSCDCEGIAAEPVVTPNVGILASTDIVAIDTACVDIVFAMKEEPHHDLGERMTSRHGLRQLTYMKELGMGNDRYVLIDLDNGEVEIAVQDCVRDLKPFEG